jgi:hypothetical protein
MPVETLLNRGINAKDFHPVGERPKSRTERKFEELKRTPLYDPNIDRWYSYMEGTGLNHECYTNNQLLGLLVEGMFGKEETQKKYEIIKRTFLDKKRGLWDIWDNIYEEPPIHTSTNELLGILVEGMFDEKQTQAKFEALKKTELYNRASKRWNKSIRKDLVIPEENTKNELLAILVEGLFDKKKARNTYETLKRNSYDGEQELWPNTNVHLPGDYISDVQLIGVLVEGLFDKKNARRIYKKLKNTQLYDKKDGVWYHHISSKIMKPVYSGIQLVGILVEATLEEPKLTPEKMIPVPEVRRF